jgi:hypothetical protein
MSGKLPSQHQHNMKDCPNSGWRLWLKIWQGNLEVRIHIVGRILKLVHLPSPQAHNHHKSTQNSNMRVNNEVDLIQEWLQQGKQSSLRVYTRSKSWQDLAGRTAKWGSRTRMGNIAFGMCRSNLYQKLESIEPSSTKTWGAGITQRHLNPTYSSLLYWRLGLPSKSTMATNLPKTSLWYQPYWRFG